jgi:predicted membrane GTPase involved in stress response
MKSENYPPIIFSLEEALNTFKKMNIEVTPKSIRLREKYI